MKNSIRNFFLLSLVALSFSFETLAAPPPRNVSLSCSPLPYSFSCSIPRTAHPQYGANCWYRSGGKGYLMKKDHRFGFYNDIVELKVSDGRRVSGQVRDIGSGRVAACYQSSSTLDYDEDDLSAESAEDEYWVDSE